MGNLLDRQVDEAVAAEDHETFYLTGLDRLAQRLS